MKGGVYGNASTRRSVLDNNTFNSGNAGFTLDNHGKIAFVGELAFGSSYRLTDTLSLRASYNLLWLEGVASAGDQFTTPPSPINGAGGNTTISTGPPVGGGAFYHGGVLGRCLTCQAFPDEVRFGNGICRRRSMSGTAWGIKGDAVR